ncbi:MAG: riboflavin kinase / adenylyltransferase [Clostridia bacterium]|jgi:riboflavin kinase/FMN adenylyltransferase|nr:riboflavin kinase / adenylyltransferase [Clostridia bacterium]
MKVINNVSAIPKSLYGSYLALGNFDGVHKGHQQLIKRCISLASQNKCKSVVVTFHPHPQFVLQNNKLEGLLTTRKVKEKILSNLQVDFAVFLPFSKKMAALSPEAFVTNVLMEYFKPQGIVIGFNYTFGKDGIGNKDKLKEIGEEFGFQVETVPPVYINGEIVSSSLIREKIKNGNITMAKNYLGYYPCLFGKVVSGEKRGRELGFPTANILPEHQALLPKHGVYSTQIEIDGEKYYSITNVGIKPTFGKYETSVETHILNFSGDIYNKQVNLNFIERLRDEQRFSSKEELITQIKKDIEKARISFSCVK